MTFEVVSKESRITGSLQESLEYMCNLGCMLTLEAHETGINISMMILQKGESLTLDDIDGEEVRVTRLS